jgi:transcriptional regulator NrdR family protein
MSRPTRKNERHRVIIGLPVCPVCLKPEHNVTRTRKQWDGGIRRDATCKACGCKYEIESIDDPYRRTIQKRG